MASTGAVARPAPALRPFVAAYHGYRQSGLAPSTHRGLPSPYLTLVVTLDDPLVVTAHADPRQAPGAYATLFGGLHTAPVLMRHDGAQCGVQVSLHPFAARALLGMPAGELAALDLPADDVLGRDAERLRAGLLSAPTWPARFAVLDRVLLARLAARGPDAARAVPPEVVQAWRRLHATSGNVTVTALSAETGWGARHLGAMMRRETGLAPKAAARVVRFDRARRAVAASRHSLAEVAARAGYADQSHLDRDFRAFSGLAPSRWYAEEVRNVQAPDGGPPAR